MELREFGLQWAAILDLLGRQHLPMPERSPERTGLLEWLPIELARHQRRLPLIAPPQRPERFAPIQRSSDTCDVMWYSHAWSPFRTQRAW